MSDTVADVLLSRLREWDVHQVSGFPGDGINGLLGAWQPPEEGPQFQRVKSPTHAVPGSDDTSGFIKQGIKQIVQPYLPGEKD